MYARKVKKRVVRNGKKKLVRKGKAKSKKTLLKPTSLNRASPRSLPRSSKIASIPSSIASPRSSTLASIVSPTRTSNIQRSQIQPLVMQGDTLTQLVIKDGRFSTLLSLVKMAGLADLLNDKKKTFTVFAPTNDAFAKLDKKTLKLLTSPQGRKKLKEILMYHVVPERFESSDIEGVSTKNTALKDEILCIYVDNGEAKVNDSKIIQADVRATNGVIHVIDTVLATPTKTCAKYGY